ncbi:peptidoglycan-associated lipoprotein Pal [Desulfurispirillum indicum]|uniref:peptidoglycan-associated lipoprotein Pal n=1 Tax=Desulfurispirillum indicum TaxID=936456 RepID=UPI001CF94FE8|nr:peptidoglycan-associated lipoprotein Pal [Desulfurispirillum indicum]UCZ55637.1 peptidoglycan-associated lipoprotein Pal [Desulfurispirillum indicum]
MAKFKGLFALLAGMIFLVAVGCAPQQVVIEDDAAVSEPTVSETTTPTETTTAPEMQIEDREQYAFTSPVLGKIYLDGTELYTVHFDFDRSSIRPDARKVLDNNIAYLKNNPNARIVIEGHCDERGSSDYNLALGDRRAQSVKDYLVTGGIDASRLTTISYGKERPVDPRSNEWAWQKNRRGEFINKR